MARCPVRGHSGKEDKRPQRMTGSKPFVLDLEGAFSYYINNIIKIMESNVQKKRVKHGSAQN
jgi:hypothetical protein